MTPSFVLCQVVNELNRLKCTLLTITPTRLSCCDVVQRWLPDRREVHHFEEVNQILVDGGPLDAVTDAHVLAP